LLSYFFVVLLVYASVHAEPVSSVAGEGAQRGGVPEKEARTPAQRKIDSQLLFEIYRRRGEAARKDVPPVAATVRIDARDRALVDIRAEVTAELRRKIHALGGAVLSSSKLHQSTIARVPVLKLEDLAAVPAVRFIAPAPEAQIDRQS